MKIVNILVLIVVHQSLIHAQDVVIRIDSLVKNVNEQNECSLKNWGSLNNTCICCIVKNAQDVFSGKKLATEVINTCLQGNCNRDTINNLMKDMPNSGLQYEALYKQFVQYIYDKTVVVKKVSLRGDILDKDGNLTPEATKQFLLQAFKEKKLLDLAFKDASSLTIKDMVTEKSEAPWGTAQLFFISNGKESFILKEMTKASGPQGEVYKLVKGSSFKPLDVLIYPKQIPGFPQFIFPIAYLSYEFNGKTRQLSLMNAAQGDSIMSLLKMFAKNARDKNMQKLVSQAYFDTGAAMAHFYKKYSVLCSGPSGLPKAIRQGDLHGGNIFWNRNTRQVTLIDNEGISDTTENPGDICADIAFLLIKTLYVRQWTSSEAIHNFPYKEWYEVTVPYYIAGFLSSYDKNQVAPMFVAIQHCIRTYRDTETNLLWYEDTELTHKPSEYIEPIFQKLFFWIARQTTLQNWPRAAFEQFDLSFANNDLGKNLARLTKNLHSLHSSLKR